MASDDADKLPLNANGLAYTARKHRDGVPLSYIAEKLGHAIEALHEHGQRHPDQRDELLETMHYLLVAHLGLNDRTLARRLLNCSRDDLDGWLDVVGRDGDVEGMAELGPS